MTGPANILEVHDLTKRFGALAAVNRVSFNVGNGEILGIIGPNGAGKTTLFDMIAGVRQPDDGIVVLGGLNITGMKPHRICRIGLAKTSQITEPFRMMTVFENVLVAALHGGRMSMVQGRRRSQELLEFVGLARGARRLAATLSVPDRRRLELARATGTGAKVLLLDETMAGLNPVEIDEALQLLKKLRDTGRSLIVVEHVMRAVLGISDRVMVLNHGTKIAEGLPAEIECNAEVIRAYLGAKHVDCKDSR